MSRPLTPQEVRRMFDAQDLAEANRQEQELKRAQRDERLEKERQRLHRLWATGRATTAQIHQCMELDRSAESRKKEEVRALAE